MTTAAPSISKDLRISQQARTVLHHLEFSEKKSISPMTALNVYGISRLAPCIYEIRHFAGRAVYTKQKRDEAGHKYTRYSLTPFES